jgi:enamine deaminase RidA (YjgF/YER057c/UK114 family)
MRTRLASLLAAAVVLGGCALMPPTTQNSAAIEQRLEGQLRSLGFPDGKLPPIKPAFGNYVDSVQVGNMLYLSSAAGQRPDGQFVRGRVPDQVNLDGAITAAKLACVRQVNRIKQAVGDLGRVKRIVAMKGKIWTQEGFTDSAKITDGCSSFLGDVFGEAGKHTRTTEGMTSLPFGLTLEVDMLVELH